MTVFSLPPYPEDIGQDVLDSVILNGNIFDIHGAPVETDIKVALNSPASRYKTQFALEGDPVAATSTPEGKWSIDLPPNSDMRADSYYRITLNKRIFRKNLPDFPYQQNLNQLEDYS